MTSVEQGRFCNSCQKAVVDFTGMSDAQLVSFFKKPSNGSICGRFNNDQLERDISIPGKRLPWLKYFFQFAVPIFLTSLKAQSQGNLVAKERITSIVPTCTNGLQATVGAVSLFTDSKLIYGRVLDENCNGVPFASISIGESGKGAVCDSAGFFKIDLSSAHRRINLVASCVGYSSAEKQINTRRSSYTEFRLSPNSVFNQEVIVTSTGLIKGKTVVSGEITSVRKTSLLQKMKDLLAGDSIYIFPNPVRAGNDVIIEWKKIEKGELSIDLYNLQGQLIKSSLVKIDHETISINFSIPQITSGSYVLRLIKKGSGKSHSEKIIIE